MKKLLSTAFMLLFCGTLMAQNLTDTIPFTSKVLKGVLPNGLTYYIQKNQEPKERADFYIIRNVGATVETDEEDGLAHFLEHMAFNGTKNFPGKGIINMLERHGIEFGSGINAYTSMNETVYTLFDIPTTDQKLVDSCLLVLHDWSRYLLLTEEELDAERGVITEEWRGRQNSRMRIMNQTAPVIYAGSPYANRTVIGNIDVIQNFKPETIRNFYYKWYRPNLEAIAIVGDIDPKAIEAQIIEIFSSIENPENEIPRSFVEIPAYKEPRFVVATDKEATQTNINIQSILLECSPEYKNTYGYIYDNIVKSMFNSMMAQRFVREAQKPEAPFMSASAGFGDMARGYDYFALGVTPRAGVENEMKALQGAWTLVLQALRHGFSENELQIVKASMNSNLERAAKEQEKTSNASYMADILDNYLENEPNMDFEVYYNFCKKVLNEITPADVHRRVNELAQGGSTTVVITGPDAPHMTQEQAFGVINGINPATIAPYADNTVKGELIDGELQGSPVVKEKRDKVVGAVKWTLANGATVIYKHADYEKESVSLRGVSMGGHNRYGIEDIPSISYMNSLIGSYGLGKFSQMDLSQKLSGIHASCGVSVGGTSENVNGGSTPKDIETMFKLLYLRFEEPRFDKNIHDIVIKRNLELLPTQKNNPSKIISDTLSMIMSDYNPRNIIMGEEEIKSVDINRIEEIYRDRFDGVKDFTFFIVGNAPEEQVKEYAEKYIGSIKAGRKKEKVVKSDVHSPFGHTEKIIDIPMADPKTTVLVNISKRMKTNRKSNYINFVLARVMDMRYLTDIREKEGGTYGVAVQQSSAKTPVSKYALTMNFDTDPDKAQHLKSLIYKGLDSVAQYGPTQEELDKIVKSILKSYEQTKPHNSYVMNNVYNYYMNGFDNSNPKYYEDIFNAITVKDVQKHAAKLVKNPDIVDLIFNPVAPKN